jgi:hypothetical protein
MNQYFADLPSLELAGEVQRKVESFTQETLTTGLRNRWRKSWRYYYNKYFNDSMSSFTLSSDDIKKLGDEGELTAMSVNNYRNLIQHLLVMTTSNRPAMEVRASNADSKSLTQARLGNSLLDYYLREKRLEGNLYMAVEQSLVLGSGYVRVDWDVNAGREYGVGSDNQLKHEGDLKFSNPSLYDLTFDTTKEDWNENNWVVQSSYRNKWDLIAQFPELADKILSLPVKSELYGSLHTTSMESEDVQVFEFFHRKTPSIPNGRYQFSAGKDIVFSDSELPFRDIPIYRIVPGNILGTQFGYSPAFDLSGLQEALNTVYSVCLTNINAFGVQNIAVPQGSDVSVTALTGGLNVVNYNPEFGEPKPLNLLQTSPEVYKFIEMLDKQMETLSGVNSVARGDPQSSLKSGAALSLIQSMAIQFASGLQNSYARLIEDVGTSMLRILRDYASTKRVVAISGKSNQTVMQDFTGDDLQNINRVVVDVGNPLQRTTAGRVELATNLLNTGLIKTPQEYLTVVTTGQLEPLVEDETSENIGIAHENEALLDGSIPVQALITDDPVLHIKKHVSLLNSPQARADQQLSQRVLSHVMQHLQMAQNGDPALAAILGHQSMQAPPPPPGTPGMGNTQPNQAPPQPPQGGPPGKNGQQKAS